MSAFQDLMQFERDTGALAQVAGRLGWDQEVMMPPGAGEQLTFRMKRYANRPTLSLPWDQP